MNTAPDAASDDQPPFRLLLVEDEPADAHLVRLALQHCAHRIEITHARDGVEALDFLHTWAGSLPDLMLVDLNMPRMNGLALISRLRKARTFTSIPIVIISTSSAEADVLASESLGVVSYLVKPMDADAHMANLREVVEQRASELRRYP